MIPVSEAARRWDKGEPRMRGDDPATDVTSIIVLM